MIGSKGGIDCEQLAKGSHLTWKACEKQREHGCVSGALTVHADEALQSGNKMSVYRSVLVPVCY